MGGGYRKTEGAGTSRGTQAEEIGVPGTQMSEGDPETKGMKTCGMKIAQGLLNSAYHPK